MPTLLALGIRDFSLIRLTSTACEQKRHADFLNEVDASLLAALAAGRVALVWDTSSRERGAGGGETDGDGEWREALLPDDEGVGGRLASSASSRAGGGLRVPRALFWGLEFLRYACESRWNGNGGEKITAAFPAAETAAEAASGADEEGGDSGGGGAPAAAAGTTSAASPLTSPPSLPQPRAFLGEAGHDVTLNFEQALRKEVPDRTKARLRYFERFHRRHRQQQRQRREEGGSCCCCSDDEEGVIRLWGCYRPSRLDRGGGCEACARAQEELFGLAFSSRSGGRSGRKSSREEEEEDDSTSLPPRFSREALALELAELGWGLFAGGEDRAGRLRASRRRREAKREE